MAIMITGNVVFVIGLRSKTVTIKASFDESSIQDRPSLNPKETNYWVIEGKVNGLS